MIDWGVGFPSLDLTNLNASGHPIWTPATHWDLLRTFKLQTHNKSLEQRALDESINLSWSRMELPACGYPTLGGTDLVALFGVDTICL